MILAGGTVVRGQPRAEPITFNRDIAPLLHTRCASCHRPDGAAPFSLISYPEVRPRAKQIARVTRIRSMPPWLPEPGEPSFADEQRLTDEEIDRIQRWVDQGAPEGNPADRPVPPEWASGWQRGAPDLIVTMTEPYTIAAGGADVYRNFVMPVVLDKRQYVSAVEFRPDNPHVVHHAVLAVDRKRSARQRDRADPGPGYDGMHAAQAESPDGQFIGWTPGKKPPSRRDDMAWRLDPGSDLVLQLHMTPGDKAESVAVSVGLYFASRPPDRTPFLLRIGSKAIDIPAGEARFVVRDRFTLPVDVELRAVYPHAHYLAREISGAATLPGGRTITLIRIGNWDPAWQDEYRYSAPVLLPRGTILAAQFTYDNSVANTRNPFVPPRRVGYGPRTTDEMGDLFLQVVPRTSGDGAILRKAFREQELRRDIEGYEATVRVHPDDAMAQTQLGSFYFLAGRTGEAEQRYRRALSLQPRLSLAHYNLGLVLQASGRIDEATAHYRQAVDADPLHPESYHAWGQALAAKGQPDNAIELFEKALQLWPEYADVLHSWGNVLARSDRIDEAIDRYRAALRIQPDHLASLNNLGITLARRGRIDEAVEILRRAVAIDPEDQASRTNLEAALHLQRTRAKRLY